MRPPHRDRVTPSRVELQGAGGRGQGGRGIGGQGDGGEGKEKLFTLQGDE